MADSNPELQEKLAELDRELEEGDITTKGFVFRPPFELSLCFHLAYDLKFGVCRADAIL